MELHEMKRAMEARGLSCDGAQHGLYRFALPVQASGLPGSLDAYLLELDGRAHIAIPFPTLLPRDAGYRAFHAVEWINFELEPWQNYEYCACMQTFRFHAVADLPDSPDALAELLAQCAEIVAEDAPTITEAIAAALEQWERDEQSSGVARTQPACADVGRKSRWRDVERDCILSFREMQERIANGAGGILMIEGPTNSGKSLLLRRLQEKLPGRVAILPSTDLSDSLDKWVTLETLGTRILQKAGNCDILCFENVDLIRTDSAQVGAAVLLHRLAAPHRCIVLNGVDCRNRIPRLLDNICRPVQLFQFVEAGQAPDEPGARLVL